MVSTSRYLVGGFLLLIPPISALAQDCSIPFTEPLFAVQEEHDIYYGTAMRYNGVMEDLRLNLFKPIGDDQTERPLIIVIHGGGFTGGHRDDRNALCHQLASMGWAAATISYRLDFYGTWLLSSPFAYDPAEVVRAAYRAQQDTRGAIRFLKARSAQDSTSTENVMLWGFSAGAIAALHATYVDEPSDKPAACNAIGNVQHFLSSYARPDLGPINGTLNINGQTEEVKGVASFYGGLLDTALVEAPLHPALYAYHQTGDPVVGCGHQQGLWGMPLGVGDNYPWLFGSCVTDVRMQHIDPAPGQYQFTEYPGSEHAVHDEPAMHAEATLFLKELFCSSVANVQVAARVLLDGPYDPGTGLMNDALRSLGTFPQMDPYPALGYVHSGAGGATTVAPAVLSVGGNDAIVDWVVLELRDALDPAVVLSSRSALLQRDGDVVEVDGVSAVTFDIIPGTYHVAVRHRNHLAVMSADAATFGMAPTTMDLSSDAVAVYGTDARKSVTGLFPAEVLWSGDVSYDGEVKYTGIDNDRDPILTRIGGTIPTAVVSGYHGEDVNLDGQVKYTGMFNDRDPILQTIGGVVPTSTQGEQLP